MRIAGPDGVEGMASADGHTVGLAIWNQSGEPRTLQVALRYLPFPHGTLRVYRIDAGHASWGDDPAHEGLAASEVRGGLGSDARWAGSLPLAGVVYLEVTDGTGASELAPAPVARVIRTDHYYPDRATTAYADFDRTTWTARLGMAGEQRADEEVGVTADTLPGTLTVSMQADGSPRRLDANSLLGLRIDYLSHGAYTSSVLFHGPLDGGADLYHPGRSAAMPWGTKRRADRAVAVPNLARFTIAPARYAPPGWDGRVQLTFILQDAGTGTRVTGTIRDG